MPQLPRLRRNVWLIDFHSDDKGCCGVDRIGMWANGEGAAREDVVVGPDAAVGEEEEVPEEVCAEDGGGEVEVDVGD